MTVATSVSKAIYAGNGVTTAWPITFPYLDDSHVKVYLTAPGGAPVLLTSDYYVDNANSQVLYPGYETGTEPPAEEQPDVLPSGWKLTILRVVPLVQEIDLTIGGGFRPEVLESGYDIAAMQIQQLAEQIDRSIQLPVDAESGSGSELVEALAGYAASAASAASTATGAASTATSAASTATIKAGEAAASADDAEAAAASLSLPIPTIPDDEGKALVVKTGGGWELGSSGGSGFFEIDMSGDLMPGETITVSPDWEVDGNGDIMPK